MITGCARVVLMIPGRACPRVLREQWTRPIGDRPPTGHDHLPARAGRDRPSVGVVAADVGSRP